MERITELRADSGEHSIIHSSPESFIKELESSAGLLPQWEGDLNPWAPGCYTSQIRIKQRHRTLENRLFAAERMAVHAMLLGLADFPAAELEEAQRDLLTSQFHDILPGSAIRPVEEASLRLLDHGLEILARVRSRLFFKMASGLPAPDEGAIPVIAYNPSPAPAEGVFECEFQPADQNWEPTFTDYEVFQDGRRVPSQVEHEASSLGLDWRKKLVIKAILAPSGLTAFACVPKIRKTKQKPVALPVQSQLVIECESVRAVINTKTGLIDGLTCDGVSMVLPDAFAPLVVADNEDPWGSMVRSYRDVTGRFTLMSDERGTSFSGLSDVVLPSVRVIEDGPVRIVVESLFEYGDSSCILKYSFPKTGQMVDVNLDVNWREKNRMLKLSIPTPFEDGILKGQVAFGTDTMKDNGEEVVTQRWQAVVGRQSGAAIAVIDDGVYGSDFADGELRVSLLHGPVYSALKLPNRPLVSPDRHHPRIDQGERFFRFRILMGSLETVLENVDTVAQQFNEEPYLLSLFTRGSGEIAVAGLQIDDPRIICAALKLADIGDGFALRLYNSSSSLCSGNALLPAASLEIDYELGPFEVATYLFTAEGSWRRTDLLERQSGK